MVYHYIWVVNSPFITCFKTGGLAKLGNELPFERLKRLRKESNKTQDEVRQHIGCTVKTYRSWEQANAKGKRLAAGADDLSALADLFQVSVDYLLCRTDDRNIGNSEIQHAIGLSEKSIEVLRQINWFSLDKDTIRFLNRVLEAAADRHEEHTVFDDLEHYVASRDMKLVIPSGEPAQLSLFQIEGKNGAISLEFDNPVRLYRESVMSSIRRQLDSLVDEAGKHQPHADASKEEDAHG